MLNPRAGIDLEQEQAEATEQTPWPEKLGNEMSVRLLSKLVSTLTLTPALSPGEGRGEGGPNDHL